MRQRKIFATMSEYNIEGNDLLFVFYWFRSPSKHRKIIFKKIKSGIDDPLEFLLKS